MTSYRYEDRHRVYQVQLNTRIPLELRQRLESHIDLLVEYTESNKLLRSQRKWPTTLTGIVETALEEYLASRPIKLNNAPALKPGPPVPREEKPPRPKLIKKTDG